MSNTSDLIAEWNNLWSAKNIHISRMHLVGDALATALATIQGEVEAKTKALDKIRFMSAGRLGAPSEVVFTDRIAEIAKSALARPPQGGDRA